MRDPGVVLLLVVAALTAAATAVRSVSRIWLRHWAERRLAGSTALVGDLDRPQRLLIAAGTGIAGAVFGHGVYLGLMDARGPLARAGQVLWAAVALLVLGQLIPRAVARRWPTAVASLGLPALRLLDLLARPLLALATRLASALVPAARTAPGDDDVLEDLLREGELEGVGEAAESAIITGVVEFGAKRVGDIMTARADIVAVDRGLAPETLGAIIAQSKYSRVPVFEGTLDRVVGMLHSFDVLERPWAPAGVLRPVVFASPDATCQDLMQRLLREHSHLAIIQGPMQETLGLATLEDLMEELVGDIHDEHDEPGPTGGDA